MQAVIRQVLLRVLVWWDLQRSKQAVVVVVVSMARQLTLIC